MIMEQVVTSKRVEENFSEKVNGPLYIPVLGDLFPRIWGDVRTIVRNRYWITCGLESFEVSREQYALVVIGEHFEVQ